MGLNQNERDTFRDYLLGRLGGEDLTAFEQRLLTDKEDFEELLAATEDDLADEYVGGQLNREEREAFESHYLITPERYEEIDFARSLDRYFQKQRQFTRLTSQQESYTPAPSPRVNLTWILRSAMAVVVFSVIAFFIYQSRRPAPQFATITLDPSIVTRGEGAHPKVNVGNADALRVQLNLPPEALPSAQYRAQLDDLDANSSTWFAANVTNQNFQAATVEIPTDQLRGKRRYALKLFATASGRAEQRIATYNFTVE